MCIRDRGCASVDERSDLRKDRTEEDDSHKQTLAHLAVSRTWATVQANRFQYVDNIRYCCCASVWLPRLRFHIHL